MKLLTGYLLFASFLHAASGSGDAKAQAALDSMAKAYAHLHAIHVVAKREDVTPFSMNSTEFELAEKSGGKYFVEKKQADVIVITASDGEKTWKALPHAKKWSQLEAAGDNSSAEHSQNSMSRDLHGTAHSMFLSRYVAVAKLGTDAEFVKQEQFKLGREKIPCAVVRVKVDSFTDEFWIDESSGLVLQDVQNGKETINGLPVSIKITVKVKEIEIDQEVDAGLFAFRPDPGWQEVEMLTVPGEEQQSLAGLRAADFRGKLLDGESFELNSLHGKVVVLDFWATWCGPCMRELPSIVKLRQDFAGKAEFIGINDEAPGVIKGLVKSRNYDMAVLMDQNDAVHNQYGVNAIPTLLIIGRNGVIREHLIGSRTEDILRRAITQAVDSPQ